MFLPAVRNCTKLVYWYLVLLSWQIHACVTGWWLCFRPSLEGMSQIFFFTVCTSDLRDRNVTRMGPCACLQVEKESCHSRNGVRKNNSWIIKGASTGAPRLVSTSVPFWASTGSKCHWLLSNLEVEKRNPILFTNGVAFSSCIWLWEKHGSAGVGVNGPCSQLPGWELHCWAVKLSCPKAACPIESCSDGDQWVSPSRMLHRHCLRLNNLPFISISPSSWACSCPLQQEGDLYGLDRAIHGVGKAFLYPFLQLYGSSRRLCSTGNSMATDWHKFLGL